MMKPTSPIPDQSLEKYGWQPEWAEAFAPYAGSGFTAGRVAVEHRERYFVLTADGECDAEVTGKLLYMTDNPSDLPKVGDWVVLSMFEGEQKGIIHDVLPRRTKFSRKVAGKKMQEQVIATNIDTTFLVQGLDDNFNLRRLERYLVMVREGGIEPVVVLNKADLCPDPEQKQQQVGVIAPDVAVFLTSATSGQGIAALRSRLLPGSTYAFVGSSGVGKSTLINSLAEAEIMKTGSVREVDAKGRHTTTHRELIALPNGSLLIDTPGMREMQLWSSDQALDDAFAEIVQLATECHFPDCSHTHEKGCAVLAAVENGELSAERYDNFVKLGKEMAYLESKNDKHSASANKRKYKGINKAMRKFRKNEYPKK